MGTSAWLSEGWSLFREHRWLFLAGALFLLAISLIFGLITGSGIYWSPDSSRDVTGSGWRALIALLFSLVIYPLLATGYDYLVVRAARGEDASLGDMLAPFARLPSVLGATYLWVLVVLVGFVLLIVPGIVWGLKYMYAPLLAVDKGLPAIDALGESGRLTSGHKGRLFLLALVFALVGGLPAGLILMVASRSLLASSLLLLAVQLLVFPWYTAAFMVAYQDMQEGLTGPAGSAPEGDAAEDGRAPL